MKHLKPPLQRSQTGAVLLVSLIMLLLLTLIGVTGMQTAGLEEKMAGNMRDRNIAFQAAEAALRDAERDIRGDRSSTATKHKDYDQATQEPFDGLSGFITDCGKSTTSDLTDDGLCYGNPANKPWETESNMTGAPSIEYGKFTGAAALSGGLSAQPRYLIEGFKKQVSGDKCKYHYRVTVRAQGAKDATVVTLQEVVKWCM